MKIPIFEFWIQNTEFRSKTKYAFILCITFISPRHDKIILRGAATR